MELVFYIRAKLQNEKKYTFIVETVVQILMYSQAHESIVV